VLGYITLLARKINENYARDAGGKTTQLCVKKGLKLPDLKETMETLQILTKLAIIKFSNYVFVLSVLFSFLQIQVKNG